MFPYIEIFGRQITLYAICSIIGMFVAGILMCKMTDKVGEDDNNSIIILLISAVGVLLGGHLLYGITNYKYFYLFSKVTSIKSFITVVSFIFGGSVFYGGLLMGIAFGFITVKIMKLPAGIYSDLAAFTIPLFHAFARVGCFLSGCCYGVESKFGFTAHGNTLVPELNDVTRFPVQLLEAFLNLVLFALIFYFFKKGKFKGRLLVIYLFAYSVIRFFDEFLRGDEIRGFVLGLSTSQFISVIIFAVTTLILIFCRKSKGEENKT